MHSDERGQNNPGNYIIFKRLTSIGVIRKNGERER